MLPLKIELGDSIVSLEDINYLESLVPQNCSAYNVYDSMLEKNSNLDDLASKVCRKFYIDGFKNLGVIVNSFLAYSLPLGPHDYVTHYNNHIKQHWIYFCSRSPVIKGGEMVILEGDPSFDLFSKPVDYKEYSIEHNKLIQTAPKVKRLFNLIKACSHPVFHINLYSYE